jgi:hypothetical protein
MTTTLFYALLHTLLLTNTQKIKNLAFKTIHFYKKK